jgi:hypothetical protein
MGMHLKYRMLSIVIILGWVSKNHPSQDIILALTIAQIFVHWSLPLEIFLHTSCWKEKERRPQETTKYTPKEDRRSHLLIQIIYIVFHYPSHLVCISCLLTFHYFMFYSHAPCIYVSFCLFTYHWWFVFMDKLSNNNCGVTSIYLTLNGIFFLTQVIKTTKHQVLRWDAWDDYYANFSLEHIVDMNWIQMIFYIPPSEEAWNVK